MLSTLLAVSLGLGAPACQIGDDRLTEISGMVTTPAGYVVVNDGADDPAARRIFFLDRRCQVTRTVKYPSRPRDTEDLARAADGTLWVADIGDNGRSRDTIALWRLAPGSSRPQLFRMTYPDGPHDAEALLLTATGTPILVTKDVGTAAVHVPAAPLRAGRTTALRKAGTVRLPITTTSNPFSLPGRLVITGGATSPDGRHVVLRTYADAFEFEVAGGDVVAAITGGTPRAIPLPDEPQGESIAYAQDGTALLTVSEVSGAPQGTRPRILSYPLPGRDPVPSSAPPSSAPPSSPPQSSPPPSGSSAASSAVAAAPAAPARRDGVAVGAAVLIGVLLTAGAGVLIAVLARRSRRP